MTPQTPSPSPGTVPANHDLVARLLPAWLTRASVQGRAEYQQALSLSHASQARVRSLMNTVKPPATFAAERLATALRSRFNQDVDLNDTQWVRFEYSYGIDRRVTSVRRQTLLEVAMANFGPEESEPGAYDSDTLLVPVRALKLEVGPRLAWRLDRSQVLSITPEQFARACREIDLGQAYQEHVQQVFHTDESNAGSARERLEASFRSDLKAQMARSLLRGDITAQCEQVLQQLLRGPSSDVSWNGTPVVVSGVRALVTWFRSGTVLSGMFVVQASASADAACVVYLPGDPDSPLKQYTSVQAFADALREKLRRPGYADYFARFICEADRHGFFERLNDTLRPEAFSLWTPKGRVDDPNADIGVRLEPRVGGVVERLYEDALGMLVANARTFVVPTAEVDRAAREARLLKYLEWGTTLLNASAFFVPGIGVLMAAVGTAQLLGEVFVGIDDWEHGQTQEALDHLFSVAENAALIAATSAAEITLARSPFVEGMLPVVDRHGATRLCNLKLTDFASPEPLPVHLQPDPAGQYRQGADRYIKLDGIAYRQSEDVELGRWYLEHPDPQRGLRVALEHNGEGAWRAAHEDPTKWNVEQAMSRLGPVFEGFTPGTLQRIRQVTGISAAQIRQIHVQGLPLPATLRLVAADVRAAQGMKSQPHEWPAEHAAAALRRDFPRLPWELGEALYRQANAQERLQLTQRQRVPLRLALKAHEGIREANLNRAIGGLVWPSMANPATARLRQGLLDLLPERERAAATAQRIIQLALADRERAARLIGQRRMPAFNGPERLDDGRIGYRLSGRGRPAQAPALPHMAADLEQARHEAEGARLEAVLNQWALQPATVADENGNPVPVDPAHRTLAAQRLRDAWHRQAPLAEGLAGDPPQYFLDLSELRVGALPALTVDFSHVSYITLEGAGLESLPTGFLLNFPTLTVLDLQGNLLSEIPAEVAALPYLESLTLEHNRLRASPTMFDALRGLDRLQALVLRNNPMRLPAPAVQALSDLTSLRYLVLSGTDTVAMAEHLPTLARLTQLENLWLSDNNLRLTPAAMQALCSLPLLDYLDLSGNPLGEHLDLAGLPVIGALNLRACGLTQWPRGLTQLMSREPLTLRRVALDNNAIVDVPSLTELAFFQEEPQVATPLIISYAGLSELSVRRLQAVGVSFKYLDILAAAASPERLQRLRDLRAHPGSTRFIQLLDRLGETADQVLVPDNLASRAWAVIDAAAQSPVLRDELFLLAQRPDACGDQVIALFNDLEAQLLFARANDATLDGPQRATELLATSRSLFRLNQVESLARAEAQRRVQARQIEPDEFEEVEVLLAYRIGLAQRLELPNQPHGMLFANIEPVTAQQLDAAAQQVHQAETREALLEWHMVQDYWLGYLRRAFAERLSQTLAPFVARQQALEAAPYDDGYDERLVALQVERHAAEASLLRALTEHAMDG